MFRKLHLPLSLNGMVKGKETNLMGPLEGTRLNPRNRVALGVAHLLRHEQFFRNQDKGGCI